MKNNILLKSIQTYFKVSYSKLSKRYNIEYCYLTINFLLNLLSKYIIYHNNLISSCLFKNITQISYEMYLYIYRKYYN